MYYLLVISIAIVSTEAQSSSNSTALDSKQREILTEFYSSTNGPNWANGKGWLDNEVAVCNWFGIKCNTGGEVTSIELEDNYLVGTCASSIFELSSLLQINLRFNNIDISLTNIGNATNLHTLILSDANLWKLDGIGSAPALKSLHLTNNAMTGTIPDELYQLTMLEELYMNYNNFTGSLSSRIGQLQNLQFLYLYQNELSGEIPSNIGQLTKLKELALGENHFTGTLPSEMMQLTQLSILALQRATQLLNVGISGELPDFSSLVNLSVLDLSGNHFRGTIPTTFMENSIYKNSSALVMSLDLSNNDLSGTVPSSLARFENINLYLQGNRLTSIDQSLCNRSSWMTGEVAKFGCNGILCPIGTYSTIGRMSAEFNKCFPCQDTIQSSSYMGSMKCTTSQQKILAYFWKQTGSTNWFEYDGWKDATSETICNAYGITCEFGESTETSQTMPVLEKGKVVHIELSSNGLSGLIPSEIYLLPYLRTLDVQDNNIELPFNGIQNAKALSYLAVSNTTVTSLSGISNATSLTELYANNLWLDELSPEIFQLTNLNYLDLSYNNFETTLPSAVKNLKNLEYFYCYQCGLLGAMPSSDLLQLFKLKGLSLGLNSFTGSFPVALYQLPSLETLVINSNPITFSFEGIYAAKRLRELYASNLGIASLSGLGQAPALESLHLTDNVIAGTFPTEIFALKTLKQLMMNYNLISGTLPSDIQKLSNLEELFLYGNQIKGQIPREIGFLTNLTSLVLSGNPLTGTLPTELNLLVNLVILSMQRDMVTGSGIEGPLLAFDQLANIQELYLGYNSITSTIPNNFLNSAVGLGGSLFVQLANNLITGTVPASLAQIDSLMITLTGNKITGISDGLCSKTSWLFGEVGQYGCDAILCPVDSYSELGRQSSPDTACKKCDSNTYAPYFGSVACYNENGEMVLTERQILEKFYIEAGGQNWKSSENWLSDNVSVCSWRGINCTTIDGAPHVIGLNLGANQLTGTISWYIFALPYLKILDLSSNDITVSFGYAAQPSLLEELYLNNTLITNITGIGTLGNLTILQVADSYLAGLPDEVFFLTNLIELDISHNELKGVLPTEIGNLDLLVSFSCYGNFLSGQIPSSIGNLVKLAHLDLAENDFTGTLPSQLNHLVNLQLLNLHQWTKDQKGIGGPLLDFSGLEILNELYLDSNSLTGTIPATLLSRSKLTSQTLHVGLASNMLEGTLSSALSRFQALNIDLTENKITGIASELCSMSNWMGNSVQQFGCDAILCESGQYNIHGRYATNSTPCQVCSDPIGAPFYGSTRCGGDQLTLSQIQVLEKFYYYTGGPNWLNQTNWLRDDVSSCNWYGISCNEAGQVISISLESNQVSGTPHSSIFTLPSLQILDLRYNPIKFSFAGIGSASQLASLILSGTGISSLDGISNASKLTSLHLTDNELSTFPEELFELSSLKQLYLDYNRLTGRLPKGIAALSNLQELFLFNNMLTGQIPSEIGQLSNLRFLVLSENLFTGTIPKTVENLINLNFLALQQKTIAGIGGPLPDFSTFSNLTTLYLGPNRLTGTIPKALLSGMSLSTEVIEIDLSFNKLTGKVPQELSRFNLLEINLQGNQLTDIDKELCTKSKWNEEMVGKHGCSAIVCPLNYFNEHGRETDNYPCIACSVSEVAPFLGSTACLSSTDVQAQEERQILQKLYLEMDGPNWLQSLNWNDPTISVCEWYGITCSSNGTVESIYLSGNALFGQLPKEIFQLPFLNEINLSGNNITIQDFRGINRAKYLQKLNLDETEIDSVDGISKAKSLISLRLSHSGLKGPVPDELRLLTTLQELDMSDNALTGEIPASLRLFTNLTMLSAYNNQLSGHIPSWISAWTKMEYLRLDGNDLSGTIPGAVGTLSSLIHLDLSDQTNYGGGGLSGPLPDFASTSLTELFVRSNSLSGTIPSTFLSNTDVGAYVEVDLSSNNLVGTIPKDFSRFGRLAIYLSDNAISDIPSLLCQFQTQWMGGNVKQYGCDAILCPPQTYNDVGYKHSIASECKSCPQHTVAPYYGSTECVVTPRGVLSLLYSSTYGKKWRINNNWMSNQTICSWYGITCDSLSRSSEFEHITRIELSFNGLSGTVPSEIFQLLSLEMLDLSNNKVQLNFEGIGLAKRLDVLNLNTTGITSLQGIGDARGLSLLNLQNNNFQGRTIPNEVYNIYGLEALLLSGSGLTGSISRQVGYLTSLRNLQLSNNEISGSIPREIGRLKNLNILDLSENDITGTLPTTLNQLTNLVELRLSCFTRKNGCINGPLLDFSELSHLEMLTLGGNNIIGSIPSTFLQSSSKTGTEVQVILTSNRLTGTVPALLSNFNQLIIDITDNSIEAVSPKLCSKNDWMSGKVRSYGCDAILCPIGTYNLHGKQSSDAQPCLPCSSLKVAEFMGSVQCSIDPAKTVERSILESFYNSCGGSRWHKNRNWMSSDVDICEWEGVSCRRGKSVDSLLLGANNLACTIPPEVFLLPSLEWLWLYSNPIQVQFSAVSNATNLKSLILDSTGLTSLDGIENIKSLTELDVRFNKLTTLPQELAQLTKLESFSCSDNEITGTIPSWLEDLKNLRKLRMGSNHLSGPLLPFSKSSQLMSIDLSYNMITGTIPNALLKSSSKVAEVYIDLSNNELSGTVPSSLSRFSDLTLYLRNNRLTQVAPDLCTMESWNGGDVRNFGCDGILCPVGTYNILGRQTNQSSPCEICDKNKFRGSSVCSSGNYINGWNAIMISISIGTALLLCLQS